MRKDLRVVQMPPKPAEPDAREEYASTLEKLAADIRSGVHSPNQMIILFVEPNGDGREALWDITVQITETEAVALLSIAQRCAIEDWLGR